MRTASKMFDLPRLLSVLVLALCGTALVAGSAQAAAPKNELDIETPETLVANRNATFTYEISNSGDADWKGSLIFKNTYPEGMTPVEPESVPGLEWCNIVERTVTCSLNVDGMHPGDWRPFYARVPVEESASGELVDKATIEGGGAYDPVTVEETMFAGPPKPWGIRDFHATILSEDGSEAVQAGSAPQSITTDFTLHTQMKSLFGFLTLTAAIEQFRNTTAHVPQGVIGDPEATRVKCTNVQLATGGYGNCPGDSQVGYVRLFGGERVALFNMETPPGRPAMFGFSYVYVPSLLTVRLRSDFGIDIVNENPVISLPLTNIRTAFWGVPAASSHDWVRGHECLIGNPSSGIAYTEKPCPTDAPRKAFLRLPTSCPDTPLVWDLEQDTYLHPGEWKHAYTETPAPVGCNQLEFTPSIEARPTTNVGDAPTGLEFHLHLPQNDDPDGLAEANLKDTVIHLPTGMTANPAFASGLGACAPAEIGLTTEIGQTPARFNDQPSHCPNASKLGSVEIGSPLLDHTLKGAAYLAKPYDNPYNDFLVLYIEVEDPLSGIVVKLPARVRMDPVTGQVDALVEDAPQLPFEDLTMKLDAGPHAALKTPSSCGSYTSTSTLTPWSFPEGPQQHPTDAFEISQGAGGGACAAAEPPNTPGFGAGTRNPKAGAYTPFLLKVTRADGTQQIRSVDTTLPPGLLARLAGVGYCYESQIDAASAKTGHAEQESPSCPASSLVGSVHIAAGAGPSPFNTEGMVYEAGPYKGAPYSLAVVTPAVAGPFDLGTVVVRVALFVDPDTAQVRAISDPIPTILRGIPLELRSIALDVDRDRYTLNPTSCDPMAVTGVIGSSLGQLVDVKNRFQLGGCPLLGFKPRLSLRVKGGTARRGHPKLFVLLTPREGDANLSYAQVTLPASELLDQGHIGTVCTRVQFASDSCPADSVYGLARAVSPLLDQPLQGPVYLRSSSNNLPDLVVALRGQIDVNLSGRIDTSKGGGLRTTFELLPDAPVSSFELSMLGGRKGLLQNSANLCRGVHRVTALLESHNGKAGDVTPALKVPGCGKGKHKPKRHRAKKRNLRGHR
jgi:hypothetical protein